MTIVQGEIQEVKNLKTKQDKPWHAVKVNNVEYGYFPKGEETFNFKQGDTIEFDMTEKGKYKNMYDPKACAIPAGELASYATNTEIPRGILAEIDYEALYKECIETVGKAVGSSSVDKQFKDVLLGDFSACVNTMFIEKNKQRRVSAKFV